MAHAAPVPAPPTSAYKYLIEVLLFSSYFVFGMSWMGYAPFLPEIQQQYALTTASTGLMISSVSFAKIFIPFLSGFLALWLGVNRTILLGMLFICASLYTPFATDYTTLLASRFAFGIGGAVVVTLIGPAVMQWFTRDELPIINGFNYVAVNSGITLALFITIPLSSRWGKNETLVAYALISSAIAIAWLLFGKDRVRAAAGPTPSAASSYLAVLKMKEAWWLTIAAAGPLCLYLVFNTWLPTFYSTTMGLTKAQSSNLTGLANMVGIPAAIIGGILTKRAGVRKPFIIASGLLTGVAAFGLFMTTSMPLLIASAVLFGIGLFLWIAPLTTVAMELPGMTPQTLAVMNGFFYSAGYLAAFFAPVIAGALKDATGSFVPGFIVFAIGSWSLVLAGIMLPETGRR